MWVRGGESARPSGSQALAEPPSSFYLPFLSLLVFNLLSPTLNYHMGGEIMGWTKPELTPDMSVCGGMPGLL